MLALIVSRFGGIVVWAMTVAARYPKSVLAPIAPRGWGHWGYDTGY